MQRHSILYDRVWPALVAARGLGGCWSQSPGAGRDAAPSPQLTRLLQQQNYPGWRFIPSEKGVFGIDVQEGNTSRVYRDGVLESLSTTHCSETSLYKVCSLGTFNGSIWKKTKALLTQD